MRVAVLGASGFIGRRLDRGAARHAATRSSPLSLRDPVAAARASAGSDAVVNLAGASVSSRWTPPRKAEIVASRVDLPQAYLAELGRLDRRPRTYVSASAIGYYGTSRTATFTEESPPGDDFLARTCVAWETTRVPRGRARNARRDGSHRDRSRPRGRRARGAAAAVSRRARRRRRKRRAMVFLDRPRRRRRDLSARARRARRRPARRDLAGARHESRLHPRRSARRCTGRRSFPVPAFAVQLLLGEAATIVTEGQRVLPKRSLETGYVFRHPELGEALHALLG